MLFIRKVFIYIALFWTSCFLAQDPSILSQPQLTVSHQVTDLYGANFGLKTRLEYNADNDKLFSSQFIQLSHFSSFHFKNTEKISVGLLYRFKEKSSNQVANEFRITQQYHFTFKPRSYRFSHRIRTEERFIGNELLFRIRYRLGIDFPLNGEELNINEFYSFFNAESLLVLQHSFTPRYDTRLSGGVGNQISDRLKLQFLVQHRWERIIYKADSKFFLLLGGYLKI